MRKLPFSLLASACFALSLATSSCASVPAASNAESIAKRAPIVIDLKSGQVLQFIMIRSRQSEAAAAVRTRYFETAIPKAERLGSEHLGGLTVKATLLGENKPRGIAIYTFPDAAAQAEFTNDPKWDEYQTMRREAWEELHIFSVNIPSDMTLTFDPAKNYTFAAAWTRPDTMPDYMRYLNGIEADFDEIGAKFVAQFNDVSLQSHSDPSADPSQLTLVEWTDGPNLKGLQATDGYKENVKYFQKAISRFDFYWAALPGA